VRQLRNLIESMVVLSPGREITADDIPAEVRDGGRPSLLPVLMPAVGRTGATSVAATEVGSREFELIVRNLVDLKLQVEELRRRIDAGAESRPYESVRGVVREPGASPMIGGASSGDVSSVGVPGAGMPSMGMPSAGASSAGVPSAGMPVVGGIEPPSGQSPNVLTIVPGMTMAEIERGAIEAALRETGGNRRKAADLLGIGERTMYRKLRDYQIPDDFST
jgi:DNA-binding NtrC family response regulator